MKNNQLVVVPGSLADVAAASGQSIARLIAACEVVVLIDQSGSMIESDTRDGRSRFDVANEELAKIQATYPGQVAVISFSSNVQFCPGGVPYREGSGTNIAAALEFTRMADGLCDIVVISDGEPNEPWPDGEDAALKAAASFKGPIHTIFIGKAGGEGEAFLDRLAGKTGGRRFVAPKPGELGAGIIALLGGGES